MFLFEVGQEVTVGKVTYEIKARFDLEDEPWYTVKIKDSHEMYNFIEKKLFNSTNKYETAKLNHRIKELEASNATLRASVEYYKNLAYRRIW